MSEQMKTGDAPETVAETAPEMEQIPVDAPRVGIIMGSKSDAAAMEAAEKVLEEAEVTFEVRVMSAHREPDVVADYCKNARLRGLRVIIAGAGLSAALPGTAAAHTDLPVIGVPLHEPDVRARWAGRTALDHADAARRAGRLRRAGQRAQRRAPGRPHPRGVMPKTSSSAPMTRLWAAA